MAQSARVAAAASSSWSRRRGTRTRPHWISTTKPNDAVNEILPRVAIWRKAGRPGVTPVTQRLLQHWDSKERTRRLFFCQIEAAETAIGSSEIAPRTDNDRLRAMNPELPRIVLKLATGADKTTVMAMLIAWQTLHTTRNSTRFTDRFLIVAPGITVRDRLRILLPADPNNTYILHDIVPRDLPTGCSGQRIVVTNHHAFKARETMQAPKLVKGILGRHDGPICERSEHRPLPFICPDAPSTDGFATPTATRSRGCFRRYCRLLGVGWISACTSLWAATLPI